MSKKHWLLISTLGKNIGDEFACIGVENLLRKVRGPQDTLEVICKESKDIHRPRPFDRAILCGMPLFWSLMGNECQHIDWWKPIVHGWVSDNPRKFAVVGAGSVIVDEIYDIERYALAIKEVTSRAHFVTTRQPVMDHPKLIDSVCPSAFCYPPSTQFTRQLSLCNLMPFGGHPYCPTQAHDIEAWGRIVNPLSDWLREVGFRFVAHTASELQFAYNRLGWPRDRIAFYPTAKDYLVHEYSRCSIYVGNRLHGAAVSAVTGAPSLGVAADNRVKMAQRLGADVVRPSQTSFAQIQKWVLEYGSTRMVDFGKEEKKLLDLLLQFARD